MLKKQDYNRLNDLGEDIEQSAIALNKLTDNLLQWALVQKNVLPYHPKLLNVASAVEEVFTLFKSTASEKNITLDSDIATDLQVYADPDSLNTIIRNLVDNGIKYTGDGGKIEINAVSGKQRISIQVKDTGVGIPEEKLKDIFMLNFVNYLFVYAVQISWPSSSVSTTETGALCVCDR